MKICSVCGIEKESLQFAKNYAQCKSCRYEKVKQYRASENGKEARRREAIKTRLSGKKQKRQKKYQASEKGKLAEKKYYENRYKTEEGKARQAAKNAVKYAIKTGKLVKESCFVCGKEKSMAHHSSYAKDMRLVVTWLCDEHHNEIHNPKLILC